jgi:hypothetical protein
LSKVLQVFEIGDKGGVLEVFLRSEMVEVEGRGKRLDKLCGLLDGELNEDTDGRRERIDRRETGLSGTTLLFLPPIRSQIV